MKKIVLISSILLAMGCDDNTTSSSSNAEKKTKELPNAKVGVLISNGVDNPFFASAYKAFQNFPSKNPNVTIVKNDARDDSDVQLRAVDDMIAKGVQAIVINMVDRTKADVILEKAKAKNIPVVFFNRSPGKRKLLSYDKAFFVDGDAVQGGVEQGKVVLEQWKAHPEWDKNGDGKIQFAMLKGIEGNPSAEARTKWSIATLMTYPDSDVTAEQVALEVANFKKPQAKNITKQWLDSDKADKIEVILANNDSMALGALQELEERGVKIPVFGIDAIPEARDLIKQGRLAGTVINDAKEQANVCLRVAISLIDDKEPEYYDVGYQVYKQQILVPYKEL